MKYIRILALLMCLLLPAIAQAEEKLPLQDAHRVTMNQESQQQSNGAKVYWWTIQTAHSDVTEQINGLAQAYRTEVAPEMARPGSGGTSRLDINIGHYRTGLTWMSFMVQSRYVLNKVTQDVRFTTRTYDMTTGEQILLTDIFPEDSEAWALMVQAVRDGINAYYPDLTADNAALEAACTREAIEQMDFTLHGMSLVLHLHAADFYPGKEQLIQITLYYPDIRPMMTEKAQIETDNLTYYYTCALTYDDGPTGWITRDILDALLVAGERATFFVVGERISGYEQYVQREHDEGHAVATHNYQHVYSNSTEVEKLQKLAAKVNEAHLELLGIAPAYCRAPGGQWESMSKAQLGWPLIQWSAQATDWEGEDGRDPYTVANIITSSTHDGCIILMHDLKKNSIYATEMFLTRLQEKGFIFLTVDELFAKDGVTLEPDTPYWRCVDGYTLQDEPAAQ